ncbi:MAG: hypothetical protein QME46_07505 [Thermoanaerobacteraceae bacterium]|nr:hypothetical protein [Thermoanaerobacteraceae bacterium]
MSNYEQEIARLQKAIKDAENKRVKAQTEIDMLTRQKEEILSEIMALGVNPDELEDEIKKLEIELKDKLIEVNSMIPWDILESKNNG